MTKSRKKTNGIKVKRENIACLCNVKESCHAKLTFWRFNLLDLISSSLISLTSTRDAPIDWSQMMIGQIYTSSVFNNSKLLNSRWRLIFFCTF